MHKAHPQAFWVLLVAMSGTAVGVGAHAISAPSLPWLLVAAFFAAAVTLELAPANLNTEIAVSLAVIVQFTAIAYAGLPAAIATAVGAGIVAGVGAHSDHWVKGAFNVAMLVIAAAFAAITFSAIVGTSLRVPIPDAPLAEPLRLSVGLVCAAVVYTMVNTVLLSLAVHYTSGVPLRATLSQLAREITLLQFVYVGLAAIAYVLLADVSVLALLFLAVPLLVARRSLQSVQERQEAYDRMVRAFVKAIQLKDGYTRGHAERVSDLSVLVAERMGLSYEERQLIRYGAILHDVGKIGVSLRILCKAGPLDDDEFAEMKMHPEIGAEMLRDIDFLRPALTIVHHHHERVDGRGYPEGRAGDEISLLTRVVTAVDAFDAMTSTRSYRRALPIEVALEELQANAGSQFDAEVVRHLVAVIHEEGWEVTDEPVAVAPLVRSARVATS